MRKLLKFVVLSIVLVRQSTILLVVRKNKLHKCKILESYHECAKSLLILNTNILQR